MLTLKQKLDKYIVDPALQFCQKWLVCFRGWSQLCVRNDCVFWEVFFSFLIVLAVSAESIYAIPQVLTTISSTVSKWPPHSEGFYYFYYYVEALVKYYYNKVVMTFDWSLTGREDYNAKVRQVAHKGIHVYGTFESILKGLLGLAYFITLWAVEPKLTKLANNTNSARKEWLDYLHESYTDYSQIGEVIGENSFFIPALLTVLLLLFILPVLLHSIYHRVATQPNVTIQSILAKALHVRILLAMSSLFGYLGCHSYSTYLLALMFIFEVWSFKRKQKNLFPPYGYEVLSNVSIQGRYPLWLAHLPYIISTLTMVYYGFPGIPLDLFLSKVTTVSTLFWQGSFWFWWGFSLVWLAGYIVTYLYKLSDSLMEQSIVVFLLEKYKRDDNYLNYLSNQWWVISILRVVFRLCLYLLLLQVVFVTFSWISPASTFFVALLFIPTIDSMYFSNQEFYILRPRILAAVLSEGIYEVFLFLCNGQESQLRDLRNIVLICVFFYLFMHVKI